MGKDRLRRYLSEPGLQPSEDFELRRWVWDLSEWGQGVLVTTACTAARLALPTWQQYKDDPDPFLGRIVGATWVGDLLLVTEATLQDTTVTLALRSLIDDARQRLCSLEVTVNETGGSAERCTARARVLAAAESSVWAAEAATWSPDKISNVMVDQIEHAARVSAGPAFETVEACMAACIAVPCSGIQMRAAICQALIAQFDLGSR